MAGVSQEDRPSSPSLPRRSARRKGRGRGRARAAVPFEDVFIPISAEAGTLLYALARAIRPETVIEFGTSFSISTIYLAAAVADNGTGRVVTTELNDKKPRRPRPTCSRRASTTAWKSAPGPDAKRRRQRTGR